MVKDIVLFTGAGLYLCFPQYFSLTSELDDIHKVFLFLNDPATVQLDRPLLNKKLINKHFDTYLSVRDIESKRFSYWTFHLKYKKILLNYLYKINPKAVLSCSDMSLSSRITMSWCKKNKVPYIILQPAFINGYFQKYKLKHIIKSIFVNKILKIPKYRTQPYFGNESNKTHLFLWSKNFNRFPKRKNVSYFGNPVFDKIFKDFKSERKIKNKIIICTQLIELLFEEDLVNEVHSFFLEAIKSKPEITFYIKLHPREPINKYNHIFSPKKYPNIKIVKNENLYDLFKDCDIQISVASFTSFEAAAIGLPIIIINPSNKLSIADFFREEIELRVIDIKYIKKVIEKALSEDYWQEFLLKRKNYFKKMLTFIDGNSAQCVSNKIRELIVAKNK